MDIIKSFLVNIDDKITPIRLGRQAKKYRARARWIFGLNENPLKIIPRSQRRQLVVTAYYGQIGLWATSATIDFVARIL